MSHLAWLTLTEISERFPLVKDEWTIRLIACQAYQESITGQINKLLGTKAHEKEVLQSFFANSEYLLSLADHRENEIALTYGITWFYYNLYSFALTNLDEIPEKLQASFTLYREQLLDIVEPSTTE